MFTGETLRLLRRYKQFTQQQVAGKLGITQQAYSKLEKQEWISDEKLNEILKAMNCSDKEWESIKKCSFPKKCKKILNFNPDY